ncbi:MAG: choice-of-anchor Q domain-containing protein, partial [Chthoniobacterales bacterium]
IQPDGKVLAGGDFTTIGPALRNRLARLDANTGAADSFDPNASAGVFTLMLQPDGKVLAGGDFTTVGGQSRSRIARLDPNLGAADAFDPSANSGASIYAIAVQPDGNILVGGNFSSIAGQARSHIARLGSDGSIPYFVNTTSDSVVAGACANGLANCSLRGAIEAANASIGPNAIIFVIPANEPNCDPSTGQCIINLTAALPDISETMSIAGPGANLLTVRHSPMNGNAFRIFNVTATGTVSFSGLTINRGSTSGGSGNGGNGGGISNASSGTVNVDRCTISDNSAGAVTGNDPNGRGGGISNNGGRVNVTNSTLANNFSFPVGGTAGGGIYNAGGVVTVTNSTLTGNTCLSGNASAFGGAIGNDSGVLDITNSTIISNSAGGPGGGVINFDIMNITNSTITGNSATGSPSSGDNLGGGIYAGNGTITVKSTIIAGNTANDGGPDVHGAFNSSGFNLIGRKEASTGFTISTDQTGAGKAPLDPKLNPNGLQNNGGPTNTIALLTGSPAIDKGISAGLTGALTTDQRGAAFARVVDDPNIANANGGDGADIGAFEVQTTTATPTPAATPTATPAATPTATPATTLGNISTRLRVETGDNVLIGGFIVTGTQPKKVIIRAIGTSLPFADKLGNPTLELHGPNGLIEANDNWVDSANKQAIIDSTIPPSSDLESAIVALLPANNAGYTAIVRGVNDGTGIGVVEAYDLDRTVDSKFANISTRGLVQTGDNVLIAGTIVVGQAAQKVIVRAIGPSLPIAGKLENPTLELRDGNGGLVEANDNWVESPNKQAIIDSTIPPSHDLESAIVQTLPANGAQYTAIVRGVNGTTGIAVVEVYALN